MFKKLNILDEKEKILRETAKEVIFPLTKEDKKLIQNSIDQLTYSQIEEYEKKYDLRPGMGLAFPQLGLSKRIIIIVHEYEDGKFDDENGNKIRIRAREELSIAFQHEIDHLNGILFFDRINKKKPFYSENEIRLI